MISDYWVVTIPQWGIFAGITVLIYGWAEKKRGFGLIGAGILVLLGLYAGWAVLSGMVAPASLIDPVDPFTGERAFLPEELPVEGRVLPHYLGLILNGVLALAVLLTDLFRKKAAKVLKTITGFFSVFLFFMLISMLRS